jgi:hypothetical protein
MHAWPGLAWHNLHTTGVHGWAPHMRRLHVVCGNEQLSAACSAHAAPKTAELPILGAHAATRMQWRACWRSPGPSAQAHGARQSQVVPDASVDRAIICTHAQQQKGLPHQLVAKAGACLHARRPVPRIQIGHCHEEGRAHQPCSLPYPRPEQACHFRPVPNSPCSMRSAAPSCTYPPGGWCRQAAYATLSPSARSSAVQEVAPTRQRKPYA